MMAAPPEKTMKDLSGKWVLSKTLSDDTDVLLQLQGIAWLLRKAIKIATVTLTIRQYTDESDSKVHIDIDSRATGGIGSTEKRTVDWNWRDHADNIFGQCNGRSRFITPREFAVSNGGDEDEGQTEWMKTGWLTEGAASADEVQLLQSYVESKQNGWSANQLWGFEEINGKRYYSRHVLIRKGKETSRARMVYDYQGPVEAAGAKSEDDGLAYEE